VVLEREQEIHRLQLAAALNLRHLAVLSIFSRHEEREVGGMSKYTEYRELTQKGGRSFEANIGDTDEKVAAHFDLNDNCLYLTIPNHDDNSGCCVTIGGETGEALFQALRQLYE
jgi:hypothetical protein